MVNKKKTLENQKQKPKIEKPLLIYNSFEYDNVNFHNFMQTKFIWGFV